MMDGYNDTQVNELGSSGPACFLWCLLLGYRINEKFVLVFFDICLKLNSTTTVFITVAFSSAKVHLICICAFVLVRV